MIISRCVLTWVRSFISWYVVVWNSVDESGLRSGIFSAYRRSQILQIVGIFLPSKTTWTFPARSAGTVDRMFAPIQPRLQTGSSAFLRFNLHVLARRTTPDRAIISTITLSDCRNPSCSGTLKLTGSLLSASGYVAQMLINTEFPVRLWCYSAGVIIGRSHPGIK